MRAHTWIVHLQPWLHRLASWHSRSGACAAASSGTCDTYCCGRLPIQPWSYHVDNFSKNCWESTYYLRTVGSHHHAKNTAHRMIQSRTHAEAVWLSIAPDTTETQHIKAPVSVKDARTWELGVGRSPACCRSITPLRSHVQSSSAVTVVMQQSRQQVEQIATPHTVSVAQQIPTLPPPTHMCTVSVFQQITWQ